MIENTNETMNENTSKKKIILASKSPRRIELLTNAGFNVQIIPADIEEVVNPALSPEAVVKSLALQKATAVSKLLSDRYALKNDFADSDDAIPIVAADTIVYLDGIIGKPQDRADAERILMYLSGKKHHVYTGVAVIYLNKNSCIVGCMSSCASDCASACKMKARKNARYGIIFSERTDVFFKPYSIDDIREYLDTDEPYDKAGAYAIQGYFGQFIDHIDGDYSNVMGLPVYALIEKLNKAD